MKLGAVKLLGLADGRGWDDFLIIHWTLKTFITYVMMKAAPFSFVTAQN